METEIIEIILDKYEKAISTYTKYKDRIERHENELRAANQIIQSLKADKEFLKTQIDELKNKIK
jgi:phage shock protein A